MPSLGTRLAFSSLELTATIAGTSWQQIKIQEKPIPMETILAHAGSPPDALPRLLVTISILYILVILLAVFSIVRSRKPRRASEIPQGQAMLTFTHNPANISRVHLVKGVTFVGRSPENDIVLPSPAVSRRHCMIRGNGLVFTISDLDSINGLLVNGRKVKHTRLYHGDVICIDGFIMTFWCRNTYSEGIPDYIERGDA